MVDYFVSNIREIKMDRVSVNGSKNAFIQWLVTKENGSNYAVRKFTLLKDGIIPMHIHKYQETVVVTKGKCKVCVSDKVYELKEGDYIFINSNVKHAIINESDQLEFFCIIDYPDDMSIITLNEDCNKK
ncbi:Uncharacterized protein J5U23_01880 [Saccharolobus shibatae B12]|uniref:Cupin type-2 domain-containing protein n=1 Tax=Saccharolobus shibatae (strain ATCC 51178 / DSM 5389 / JCM 8931 / NBRC 15437 / B12) TaxID=523848 RepID=A0A8F5GTN9_SACSH|nr:cupin domain-containing protein [Saccharolobus shibatae]QXJ29011.1 Uncharacterized protein J5U23_01880 [Saccharolobus shibatae B12]